MIISKIDYNCFNYLVEFEISDQLEIYRPYFKRGSIRALHTDISQWIFEYSKGLWEVRIGSILFELEEDAIAFKLRWAI